MFQEPVNYQKKVYKILHPLLNLDCNIVCFRNQSAKKKEAKKKVYKIFHPLLDLGCNIYAMYISIYAMYIVIFQVEKNIDFY